MEIGIDPVKLYLKYDSALYSVMLKKKKKNEVMLQRFTWLQGDFWY